MAIDSASIAIFCFLKGDIPLITEKMKKMLDWQEIIDMLTSYAMSEEGKETLGSMNHMKDYYLIQKKLKETTEAKKMLNASKSIPLHALMGIKGIIEKLNRQEILSSSDLTHMSGFIRDCQKMIKHMQQYHEFAPQIAEYALSMSLLDYENDEIIRCITHGTVSDEASVKLSKIRKKIHQIEDQIKIKLQSYLTSTNYGAMLTDSIISQRDGRYVIPVKAEHKRDIDGAVLDRSRSGGTVFVEPAAVKKLHDTLSQLKIDEYNEVYRVLSELSNMLMNVNRELEINYDAMVSYDILFAKAKLSNSMSANAADINQSGVISIINGKHPLLGGDAVPLTLELNQMRRNLIITGPNTGGKTVSMKTVGLFVLMTQAGLHVPCSEGTTIHIFDQILCDIGDGQSLTQNLSTFSSHIKNINEILDKASGNTLVILDEIGAGTDPSEGMGIGIAVLEYLNARKSYTLASTHYNEIKSFAANHPDFINGSMAFDIKSLMPLYRLEIGKSGESNALLIALRIGMSKAIIERAHEIAYNSKIDVQEELEQQIEQQSIQVERIVPELKQEPAPSIFKPKSAPKFNIGDAVYIHTMKRTGIVCETENAKGEIGVQVMNKKIKVNHKRLSLYLEADELYPEDYDMSIVFKTKEQRKNIKKVSKGKKDIVVTES